MGKIDLSINKEGLQHNIQKAKENNIIIPTIAQMQNPDLIPEAIKAKLSKTGLWDVDPVNLFRINWHNEAKESGGLYQKTPNYVEIPSSVSGVPCRILAMSGKWFPTGCHKVGASFGCLAPRLVTGQFDATYHHAVWPSTGNYCRGGAFNSKLLACDSVAILPQDMSKERFDWLKSIAGQIIATPGCESNVKEIFDKTWELKQDPTMMIFNQFAEMGNPLWHYNVTGYALSDLFESVKKPGQRLAGACFTSGSAGTMSAGDLLKERYSDAYSPMIYTAKLAREKFGDDVKCVFVGPCLAKRVEAVRKGGVDGVITFSELAAVFMAKNIDVREEAAADLGATDTFADCRQFAVSTGVAGCVLNRVADPASIRTQPINGVDKKMFRLMKTWEKRAPEVDLIEVMCCEEGCLNGPGTIVKPMVAKKLRGGNKAATPVKSVKSTI